MSLAHMLKVRHGGSIMQSKHRGNGDRVVPGLFWPSSLAELVFPGLMRDLVSKLITWGWIDEPTVKSICFCRGPKISFQHLGWAVHNLFKLQFQGI